MTRLLFVFLVVFSLSGCTALDDYIQTGCVYHAHKHKRSGCNQYGCWNGSHTYCRRR